MIRLLLFLELLRIKKIFEGGAIISTIFKTLIIVYGGILGFTLGHLIDEISKHAVSQENSIIGILPNIIVCLFPIVFNIIFYKPKTDIIPKLYPISTFEKVLIEYLYDLFSSEYVTSFCIIFSLFVSSKIFDYSHLLFSINLILVVNIFINIGKLIIERSIRLNKYAVFLLIISTLLITYIYSYKLELFFNYLNTCLVILTFFSFSLFIYFEKFQTKQISKIWNFFEQFMNPFILLIWMKIESRKFLLIYAISKITICCFLSYLVYIEKEELDRLTLSYSLMMMIPIMVLPLFVNTWGFMQEFWLLIRNNSTDKGNRVYFNIYKQTILPIIITDAIFTCSWAFMSKIYNLDYYIYYLSVSLIVFWFGYFASIVYPGNQKKYNYSNIGILISFVFMALCLVLMLPIWHKWFYLIDIVLGGIGYYCIRKSPKWVELRRYMNYINLSN